MSTVVLDSSNLDAMVKDATGEGLASVEGAETVKTDTGDAATQIQDKADDLDKEGDDGLTQREKAELSAKMLKAVGKRVREKREAEEFAAEQYNLRLAAEKEVERLRGTQPAPSPIQDAAKVPPVRDSFKSDEEYIAALVNHGVESKLAERQAQDAKADEENRQATILANARTMVAKAMDLVPDFEDITRSADVIIPPYVAGYMQKSPLMAEFGYYFAQNQKELEGMHKMEPDAQLVALGEIKSKLKPFSEIGKSDAASSASTTSKSQSSTEQSQTGNLPSAARKPAPVITPISSNGSSGDVHLENVRDHIAEFARTRGVNLSRRQRH